MNDKKYLTITALTKYLKYKFDTDIHLKDIMLEGEISNFKHHSRGHFYFTLKDNNAQISATMFYGAAQQVKFIPKDGMMVNVRGNITLYEAQGSYQINVVLMEQKGLGDLYQAYLALKKELEEEGYFRAEHKKSIPQFPKSIGVLTSPTGAAVRDIINTINRRYPLAAIYIYPTLVQGEAAKDSIVSNIILANKQKLAEVLIIGRGGGSIEDLWAFNERIVATAIYQSELPIISAVGHETDFTIADFVADIRAATPTAAAEIATPNLGILKDTITTLNHRLQQSIEQKLKNAKINLVNLDYRLDNKNPILILRNMYERKLQLDQMLKHFFTKIWNDKLRTFQNLKEKLQILNPLSLMEKGYSVVLKDELVVNSATKLETGNLVTIKFYDGQRRAIIAEDKDE